ncbi:hypothetical protein Tco_0330779 [Tanacetum coccineum]
MVGENLAVILVEIISKKLGHLEAMYNEQSIRLEASVTKCLSKARQQVRQEEEGRKKTEARGREKKGGESSWAFGKFSVGVSRGRFGAGQILAVVDGWTGRNADIKDGVSVK